jgi:acetyltransferase-like isoleucine patch superfamily enzyme
MRKLAQNVYHKLTKFNAALRGVKTGKNILMAAQGRIRISGGSVVSIGDNVIFASGYQIDAHGGSEIHIGCNVHFGEGVRLHTENNAKIVIGEGSSFNHNVSITALQSIIIGKDSIFGPYVYLSDHNHQTARDTIIKKQGYHTEPVSIGSDVWMGVGSTVLRGGCLGDGCVVAAHGVVTKNVPAYEIWGGVPAKKIGERS